MNQRIGVTDEEWAIIGALLPPERGRCAPPAQDNWRYFEGMRLSDSIVLVVLELKRCAPSRDFSMLTIA